MGFPYLQRRSELVSSIMRMAQTFGLRQEVAHDAILLMDRAMSTSLQVGCPTSWASSLFLIAVVMIGNYRLIRRQKSDRSGHDRELSLD